MPVEIGRAVLKTALSRIATGNPGAALIGMDAAGDVPAGSLRSFLVALKAQLDAKAGNADPRLSDQRTPTDASVTNAKVAPGAAIAESKLALASDAAANVASRRTLGTGATQAAAGNDPRLSDQRTPTDASVTNAKVAPGAAIEESKLALASDAAAAVASRRTLGTGATQATAGNDPRLSDQRVPTDASVTAAKVAAANKDGSATEPSMRTLGTGSSQAAAGNHGHAQLHDRNHKLLSVDHTDVDSADVPLDGDVLTYSGASSRWTAAPAASAGGGLPPGVTVPYAGNAAPAGWLPCDGSAVSRTSYAALFAAIGTIHGAGDGATTFNLPDTRGRAPVGRGTSPDAGVAARALGEKTGQSAHTLATAEMPSHAHGGATGTDNPDHAHNYSAQLNAATVANGTVTRATGTQTVASSGATARHNHAIAAEGEGREHNNMQPSYGFEFIIKT